MLQHERRAKANAAGTTTPSAILGPFYLDGLVPQPMGTSVIGRAEPGADFTHLFGVINMKTIYPEFQFTLIYSFVGCARKRWSSHRRGDV